TTASCVVGATHRPAFRPSRRTARPVLERAAPRGRWIHRRALRARGGRAAPRCRHHFPPVAVAVATRLGPGPPLPWLVPASRRLHVRAMNSPSRPSLEPALRAEAELDRMIGPVTLGATAVNLTVGAGIFALPAAVAAILGPSAVLAYL